MCNVRACVCFVLCALCFVLCVCVCARARTGACGALITKIDTDNYKPKTNGFKDNGNGRIPINNKAMSNQ
jgi:hypothetical protein